MKWRRSKESLLPHSAPLYKECTTIMAVMLKFGFTRVRLKAVSNDHDFPVQLQCPICENGSGSWASPCTNSNINKLAVGTPGSRGSVTRMCHRHPRNVGNCRTDVGTTIRAANRFLGKQRLPLWCIGDDVFVAVRQSRACGVSVLDSAVAHDGLLFHLSGKQA